MAAFADALGADLGVRKRAAGPFSLIRVRGRDAVAFLQGLCTQDIASMAAGEARPAAFLSAKGKLLATANAGRTADSVWLETTTQALSGLAELLDRYHFAEQLELATVGDWRCVEAFGVDAPAAVGWAVGRCVELDGGGIALTGERHGLSWARAHAPAPPEWPELPDLSADDAEAMRIAAGLVAVGRDTDGTTLGMEADLEDHISTTKGCYTGQEIVARIQTYGHVNRKICVLLIADGAAFAPGTALLETEDGDPVGRAMTSAPTPDGRGRIALGYLPSDFWAHGTELRLATADGPPVRVIGFG